MLRPATAPAPEVREQIRTYADHPVLGQSIAAFRDYILARRRVDNLRDVFQGVALLAILLAFGAALARQGASWAVLLTYLVAPRYATKSMGQVSTFVTPTNRYAPHIKRYCGFLTRDLPPDGPSGGHLEADRGEAGGCPAPR